LLDPCIRLCLVCLSVCLSEMATIVFVYFYAAWQAFIPHASCILDTHGRRRSVSSLSLGSTSRHYMYTSHTHTHHGPIGELGTFSRRASPTPSLPLISPSICVLAVILMSAMLVCAVVFCSSRFLLLCALCLVPSCHATSGSRQRVRQGQSASVF